MLARLLDWLRTQPLAAFAGALICVGAVAWNLPTPQPPPPPLLNAGQCPPLYRDLVESALRTGKMEAPAWLAELRPVGGDRRQPWFRVVSPQGEAVASAMPHFVWTRFDGATSYQVRIAQGRKLVLESPLLDSDTWQASQPLDPGDYEWEVEAAVERGRWFAPAHNEPPAVFRVPDAQTLAELATLPPSHLVRGLVYARQGAMQDAVTEFRRLSQANPQSVLAQKLLEHALRLSQRW